MRQFKFYLCLILGLALPLSSCQSQSSPTPAATAAQSMPTPSPRVEDTQHTSDLRDPTEQPNPLPPEPLDLVFFSQDGVELQGRFFPAAALDRPVVVLMHWYPGDQNEWEEIAYWLQNRGGIGTRRGVPWLDPSWFPDLAPDTSYNVLTFTFQGCQGGCSQLTPAAWRGDALASLEAASSLQGVNPAQVVAIGASIGGDAAISSCAAVLAKDPRGCLGALSLSPGNYLGESYPELVSQLEDSTPPRPAWCLYDKADPDGVVCKQAVGDLYYQEGWQGGNLHGMHLITPALDPLPLLRLVEFLETVTNFRR